MAKDAEKRGKRQKKQAKAAEKDAQAVAPGGLPERLQGHHRFVACGPDMNFHVRREPHAARKPCAFASIHMHTAA